MRLRELAEKAGGLGIAPTGQALRSDLVKLIERLRGAAMPRVWNS